MNVTFSPTMTLPLYAPPFLSSAACSEFKEFDAPRQAAWSVYGRDRGTIPKATAGGGSVAYTVDSDGAGPAQPFTFQNPDFNFLSLCGNAVFRWEYLPGSTLSLRMDAFAERLRGRGRCRPRPRRGPGVETRPPVRRPGV